MTWEALTTMGVLLAALIVLIGTRHAPDVILMAAVSVLTVLGVLTPAEALTGLSNEGVVTIAVLFAVAAGLRETGAMRWVGHALLGRPRSLLSAQLRIMLPSGVMSAFMNNTPLVAIMMPVVGDWAKRNRFAASKLLIPLSYASILGGACTLIGTSTNLVVNGWLMQEAGCRGLAMFELARVGLPCAAIGMVFLIVCGKWLLPDRRPPISAQDDPRSYTVETMVQAGGPLDGKTIEQAGLRSLPGLYLMEIERGVGCRLA